VDAPDRYLALLAASPLECDALFRDLLIGVTRFFRDPDAWASIDRALGDLLAKRPDGHALRVWVAGCASGEEAYSIAITIDELLERSGRRMSVEILATDLDEEAIRLGREGRYPPGIAADVGADRLARFFARTDRGYLVSSRIRQSVVFARHDVLKDPPPTPIDLILCRNVLIYLETDAQRRLFPVFHEVLRRDGLLVLGPSETAGAVGDRFEVVDRKWRVFRRMDRRSAALPRASWRPAPHGALRLFGSRSATESHEEVGCTGVDVRLIEQSIGAHELEETRE
jgi:two-component system CheB/CheR fusion protein